MRFYVETYGCQMNECDSAGIVATLEAAGHTKAAGPSDADAVIVNTCAVRERAEVRVLGRLRHLRGLMRPSAVLGVVGCVAQRMGGELLREVRGVAFVLGTERHGELPEALGRASAGLRTVDTTPDAPSVPARRAPRTEARLRDFVTVMRGCDNFCSYCVVPHVRGRERSLPAEAIVAEVESLVALGARDVTLLGQNVNSYRDGDVGFAELLARVSEVPGLPRLRFATSHPKDLSDDIIEALASRETVCRHVHLPAQSGSDETLSAMNRRYTRADYLRLVRRIRERVPGVAITTDVIVGFPGETPDRFEATLSLMREVRFDSAFMFRYSPRPGTAAAALDDDVPEAEKVRRLEQVIRLQKRTSEELNAALVGSVQEVLVEGPSERDGRLLFGRTGSGKGAVFEGSESLRGALARVRVTASSAWTLRGDIVPGRA
ncbi:MAG: tRNA (N6-isopentenyl adenosine(37)-C2)-methylthiotransferase MiaB [Candidatus Eisenbacteria bacterium]|nr:tRNA (N6-isopentenyl adenosine(37)-C2)-methylthiotransferase MiaB [Candidatus Eisenbacteria bacterium]